MFIFDFDNKNNNNDCILRTPDKKYTCDLQCEGSNKNNSKDFKIAFNSKLVLDAIKTIKADNITLQFSNNLSPLQIDTSEAKYLILPIKINE